jgi:predicted  nucleic acid-binding Zn-ribbon protein
MKNEDKIVELLTEMLVRHDGMLDELKNVKTEVSNVKAEVKGIKTEMVKLNLQTVENTRAIFKLAEKVEEIADLHKRVTKLEQTVYK